ncbi:MAG: redoxin domain-containing protein [Planctomycetes bacterium]|nr:redoxin domain-containing protein [Planctomycetota bacterium]
MRHHALALACLATSLLCAQDEPDPFGHSRHGSEFDEGPRQAAYLMPGMSAAVHFPVAGLSAEAQLFFDQAMTQQHGFWYYESERSFRQVAKLRPDCAMAYWGMAMANRDLPVRAAGFTANAVMRATDLPRNERLWIEAWARYYDIDEARQGELRSGDGERVAKAKEAIAAATGEREKDNKEKKNRRELRLLEDLDTIVHEFPDDLEAKALLAVHIWYAYGWGGGVAISSYGAVDALLDQVFDKEPLHPAHHYRVHLWDQRVADRALASAAVMGSTAPAIAHQWHMAGHIYAKLDRHAEAAWQQEASSRADHAHMQRDRVMPFEIHNYGHNQEWLCRSLSHVGRWQQALELAKNMAELPRHPKKNRPAKGGDIAGYARQRIAMVCEDHELWAEAVALCRDGYLESGGDLKGEVARLSLLGRALFRLDRSDEAERVVAEADALLVRARAERAAAIDGAEDAAIAASKDRAATDKAIDEAWRKSTVGVGQVLDLQRELRGERSLAAGDATAAAAEFEAVKGMSKALLADVRIRAGQADKAVELLEKEVKARPGRLPTLRRLVTAHRAVGGDAAAQRVRELEAQIAAIPADIAAFGADFGSRPPLESLGPFRWHPTRAPALELPVAGGGTFRLDGGQPTLVVFYLGFGCLHCVEQLQAIAPLAERFAAAGIRIVAVGSDTAAKAYESLQALDEGERFPFPLLADPELLAFKTWRCFDDFEVMPLHGTFLVDGDGRVCWQDISFEPFTEVEWLLGECRRLLALPAASGAR